eukprot:3306697-Pyramimonas_sp.AAC.1
MSRSSWSCRSVLSLSRSSPAGPLQKPSLLRSAPSDVLNPPWGWKRSRWSNSATRDDLGDRCVAVPTYETQHMQLRKM